MKIKNRMIWNVLSILLVLVLLSVIAYAWMSKNRKVESASQPIQLNAESMVIDSWNVYHYDYDNDVFEDITDEDVFTMATYDTIFTERNINTSLLFAVKVSGLKAGTKNLTLELDCAGGAPEENAETKYTSNIVCVKAVSADNSTITGLKTGTTETNDCKAFYTSAANFFEGVEAKAFLKATKVGSMNDYTFEKQSSLLYTVSLSEAETEARSAIIYFFFSYDEDLIAAQPIDLFSKIDIMGQSIEDNMIVFDNDITLVTFTTEAN